MLRSGLLVGATAAAPSSLDKVTPGGIQSYSVARASEAASHDPGRYSDDEYQVFMHGVASGDPLPNSVVLWTRVTPDPSATPGSGRGEDVHVEWEIARDASISDVVERGTATASVATDHTVHVEPHTLKPYTQYFYRFTVRGGDHDGVTSPVGRTLTAPADNTDLTKLRLAVCSCANYEAGYFRAYSDIARRANDGEIDVVVHMGDYIYEYASGEYAGKHGVARPHVPTWELNTGADYRARYGHYRRDPELQAAHAAAPWVVTWDDHEFADNAYAGGAVNHQPLEGDWNERRNGAMAAYLDWIPIRATNPSKGGHIYRSLRFGTLAEIHMLDLRTYRTAPGKIGAGAFDGDRTIMGSEQFDWLAGRLSSSQTRWNLVGTSVMMAPMNVVNVDSVIKGPLLDMIGQPSVNTSQLGLTANPDQWDGYAADRFKLLDLLASTHPEARTVFLTGDIHSEWANAIEHKGKTVAAELVCSSVTAKNIDDALKVPQNSPITRSVESMLLSQNPHVKHVDLDAHGYALLTVDNAGAQMQWMRVDDVETAGSPVSEGPQAVYRDREISVRA